MEGSDHFLCGITLTGLAPVKAGIYDHAVEQIVQAGNQSLYLWGTLRGLGTVNILKLLCAGKIQTCAVNAKQVVPTPGVGFCFLIKTLCNSEEEFLKCFRLDALPSLGKGLLAILDMVLMLRFKKVSILDCKLVLVPLIIAKI